MREICKCSTIEKRAKVGCKYFPIKTAIKLKARTGLSLTKPIKPDKIPSNSVTLQPTETLGKLRDLVISIMKNKKAEQFYILCSLTPKTRKKFCYMTYH